MDTLQATLDKIASFAALEPGWDSYDADPITPDAIAAAATVVKGVAESHRLPWWTAPICDGGVDLEWKTDGGHLQVWLRPDGCGAGYLLITGENESERFEEADVPLAGIGPLVSRLYEGA